MGKIIWNQSLKCTLLHPCVIVGRNTRFHTRNNPGHSLTLASISSGPHSLRGNHRWPVYSSYKGPLIRQKFICHNVIMWQFSIYFISWWYRDFLNYSFESFQCYGNNINVNAFHALTHFFLVYASMNWVIIGSGNGLWHLLCQAITWTKLVYCQLDP